VARAVESGCISGFIKGCSFRAAYGTGGHQWWFNSPCATAFPSRQRPLPCTLLLRRNSRPQRAASAATKPLIHNLTGERMRAFLTATQRAFPPP
jgi:hypothetical protein